MTVSDDTPREFRLRTPRTARYAVIGAALHDARRLWFALHGYGQLAPRFLRHFAGCVPADTCIVAPEGLSRFYIGMPQADGSHLQRVGATWMTREAREDDIADTREWLDAVHRQVRHEAPDVRAVGVLAFSQGVATASRWIADGGISPDMFVAWAGAPAHDVPDTALATKLARAQLVAVCGTQDPLVSSEQRDAVLDRLRVWNSTATLMEFVGGHTLDAPTLTQLLERLPV